MGHRTKAELGEREPASSGTRTSLPVPEADPLPGRYGWVVAAVE
jgi:hypothetical protein